MNIKLHSTIDEIGEKAWDSIVEPGRIICSHRYLSAIEKSNINDCRYFYPVVYQNGEIVAHTCLYSIGTELDLFAQGPLKNMVDGLRKIWKNFMVLRSIECGTPVALGNTISFKRGIDKTAAFGLMHAEAERLAKKLGIKTMLFRDFYDEDIKGLYGNLSSMGFTRIHNLPGTKIKIRWKSFDEYLNSMRSNYKMKIIKRKRACLEGGLTIEVLKDFASSAEDLARLWMNVNKNAKEYCREKLTRDFFVNMSEKMDESAVILIKKGNLAVGFGIILYDHLTLISMYFGLDYDYNKEYSVYFNLLYKLMELAIENKMEHLDLGITTLVPKKDIGVDVIPIYMYMKHLNPVLNRIIPRAFDSMTPRDTTSPRSVFKTNLAQA